MDAAYAARFHDYLVGELGLSPKTVRAYLQGVQRLERFASKPVEEIEAADLREFLRRTDFAPATKTMTLTGVKSIRRFEALEGFVEMDGLEAVRAPKVVKGRMPAISFERIPDVLRECRTSSEFRVVWLGLYAGLRVEEATWIRERDWDAGWLTVLGKGRKLRGVPVHPELERYREVILLRPPTNPCTLNNAAGRIRDRLGLFFTTHYFRRSFARRLEDLDVPEDVRAELLGHSPSMTSYYSGVSERRMIDAISKLNY